MSIKSTTIKLAANNNAAVISATPVTVVGIYAYKATAGAMYVKLYNKATTPAPASEAALLVHVQAVPTLTSACNILTDDGIQFKSGCGIAITAGATLGDNTATAANDGIVTISYIDLK